MHLPEVQGIFRLAQFCHVEAVVPWGDPEAAAVPVDDGLHLGHLRPDPGRGRLPHRLHEGQGALGAAGHGRLHGPVGVAGVAQQPGPLMAQPEDLRDQGIVVGPAAVVAPADEGPPDPLAQGPVLGAGEQGLHHGAGVGDHPAPLQPPGLGVPECRRPELGGQAGQLRLPFNHREAAGLLVQDILAEAGEQLGQPLVDGLDPRLAGRVGAGSAADELGPGEPGEALLLRGQAGLAAPLVDRFDPLEKPGVLGDLIGECGQPGHDLGLDPGHVAQLEGAGVDLEQGAQPLQHPPGPLQGGDGVGEGGRAGIAGDPQDPSPLVGHGPLESGRERLGVHPGPGRDPAEGPPPGREHGRGGGRRRFRQGRDLAQEQEGS